MMQKERGSRAARAATRGDETGRYTYYIQREIHSNVESRNVEEDQKEILDPHQRLVRSVLRRGPSSVPVSKKSVNSFLFICNRADKPTSRPQNKTTEAAGEQISLGSRGLWRLDEMNEAISSFV